MSIENEWNWCFRAFCYAPQNEEPLLNLPAAVSFMIQVKKFITNSISLVYFILILHTITLSQALSKKGELIWAEKNTLTDILTPFNDKPDSLSCY